MSDLLSPTRAADTHRTADFVIPPVRPLDCSDLRLMAVAASDDFSPELVFCGTDGSGTPLVSRVSVSQPVAIGQLRVPARGAERVCLLDTVTAEVDGAIGHIDARRWSAACWSESSVEKFLYPYLAALGGPQAATVLADVDRAWNGYPDHRRPFALLHAAGLPEGTSLDVRELVHVWYVDTTEGVPGRLIHESVATFLQSCTPSTLPRWDEVTAPCLPPEVATASPHLPSPRQLRRVAEWASEFRGEPHYFSFNLREGTYTSHASYPGVPEDHVLIPARTQPTRADRPVPTVVTLQPVGDVAAWTLHALDGNPDAHHLRHGDAAFWRTGAVEHLMSPYYVSVYGGLALEELGKIVQAWNVVPQPGSVDGSWTPELGMAAAIVHLPKSNWEEEISLPMGPGPVVPAGLLVTGGPGSTRLVRVSELED